MNYSWCENYHLAKDWQTLIGSLLALTAALLTIAVMLWQTGNERKRYRNQLKRKKMAARARMPDALSELMGYARETGRYLTEQTNDRPTLPTPSIEVLKQVIEHIDDDAAAKTFELVSWYQVQRARLQGLSNPQHDTGSLYDIALLHALTDRLFDYGRNEAQTTSSELPSQHEMTTALRNTFGFEYVVRHEEQFFPLVERIQRRHQS